MTDFVSFRDLNYFWDSVHIQSRPNTKRTNYLWPFFPPSFHCQLTVSSWWRFNDSAVWAWLCGAKHTAELDSVVGCTPSDSAVSHCEVFFEKKWSLDSAVGITLRSLTLWWDAHHGAPLRGGMHTTEPEFLRTFDHKTPWCDAYWGVWLRGMMHTAESDSVVGCTPGSFLKIRITRRNRNRIR